MPDTFTPEQIAQILEEFFKVVGTRQYIGARYVPIFGRKGEDSIEWDNTAPYEPLTIVLYQGNSYTSRQFVPVGVEITNHEFWAITGNYNAQVEQYRRDTAQAIAKTDILQNEFNTILPKSAFSASNTVKAYIDGQISEINSILPKSAFSASNTVKAYIDGQISEINSILPASAFSSSETVKNYIDTNIDTSIDTSKAYIDGKISEINSILPASAFSSSETVKSYIDSSIDENKQDIMVVVGDSYTARSTAGENRWVEQVAKQLNLNAICWALAGMGYVRSINDNTFLSYLENTYTNIGAEKADKVKYVIVYGGINDVTLTSFDAECQAVRNVCATAKNLYPHARIIIVGPQSKALYIRPNSQEIARAICEGALYEGCSYVNPSEWLFHHPTHVYKSDDVHPTDLEGQRIIAGNMISVINGHTINNNYIEITPNTELSGATIQTSVANLSNSILIAIHVANYTIENTNTFKVAQLGTGFENYLTDFAAGTLFGCGSTGFGFMIPVGGVGVNKQGEILFNTYPEVPPSTYYGRGLTGQLIIPRGELAL